MVDLLDRLRVMSRGMWRCRWWGVVAAWTAAALGTGVVFLLPSRYEASARVYVDTATILRPLMTGLVVEPNVNQQVSLLGRTLISRPNVEKLARMAIPGFETSPEPVQDKIVDDLMRRLQITGGSFNNLYMLSYRDEDPDKGLRVIESLVSIFVNSSLGASRKDSAAAKQFIDEQIHIYENKLAEAENKLKEFRLRTMDQRTADGKDSATRLSEISAELDRARLELREAENARDTARAKLETERSTVSTPELDARIEAQKKHLDTLLQRFTQAHPEVQSTRQLLAELEEQRRRQLDELRRGSLTGAAAVAANGSPAALELSRLLATAEVQVATLRARVSEYSARYAQARQRMQTAPQIEAEAAQLNRDYAIHKKNYDDLVARRESATITSELEQSHGGNFRLIDPPRVSNEPVTPNRLLLLPLTLVAAIAAGLLAAYLRSQARPVFSEGQEVHQRLGLPVLGMVSMANPESQRRSDRWALVGFAAASGSLVGVFLAGLGLLVLLPSG